MIAQKTPGKSGTKIIHEISCKNHRPSLHVCTCSSKKGKRLLESFIHLVSMKESFFVLLLGSW